MSQLDRLLDVLEYLASHGEAGVGEMCADLGLPRPTCHRLLSALQARGYVEHDAKAPVYRLGIAAQMLARSSASSGLARLAAPMLARLLEVTNETVNLAVLNGSRIVYEATLDGTLLPRMSAQVGELVIPHATALGKAIVARLPEQERMAVLGPLPFPRFTSKTITDMSELEPALEEVVRKNYAIENEESQLGAVCVAAAVSDFEGRPRGAVSISGVTARMKGRRAQEYGEMLVELCGELSRTIGSAPGVGERAPLLGGAGGGETGRADTVRKRGATRG